MEFSWLENKFVTDTGCSNQPLAAAARKAASRRICRLRGKSDNDVAI